MRLRVIQEFLRLEAASGIILAAAAALALAFANSPLAFLYDGLLGTTVAVEVGALELRKPLLLWINDGLMAVFFLLVGLEIKREVLQGELSTWGKASLPAIAATGGMVVPAAIYAAINVGDPERLHGWAIPAATDIAFALGVLALLNDRVPASLKIFLLALAIIDDLGAIVIIAVFYTANLSMLALGLAATALLVLFVLNRLGVRRIMAYVLVGLLLWTCVLKSGVHATLAGVALALAVPLDSDADDGESPLSRLESSLHWWVAYGILPLFAFANAGVALDGLSLETLAQPVPLGIASGLFIGKQLGVFLLAWLAVRLGIAERPADASWRQIYGVALLCGIGFTMSLFIGTLAFEDPAFADDVRIGVLGGSLLSAAAGFAVLRAGR